MFQFKLFKNYSEQSLAVLLGVIILSLGLVFITLAWTEPSYSPPTGDDVAAPINVSGTTQTKSGILNLGTQSHDYMEFLHQGDNDWALWREGSGDSDNQLDVQLHLMDDLDDSEKFSIFGGACSYGSCGNPDDDEVQHWFSAAGNAWHRGDLTAGEICIDGEGCKGSWSDISGGGGENLAETLAIGNSAGSHDINMNSSSQTSDNNLIKNTAAVHFVNQETSYIPDTESYLMWDNSEGFMYYHNGSWRTIAIKNDVSGAGDGYLPDDPANSNVNMNGNSVTNVRNIYGDGSRDVYFYDRPRSQDGLYIQSGTAYFNGDIRVDHVQDRGGGNTIYSDSHWDWNNHDLWDVNQLATDYLYKAGGGNIHMRDHIDFDNRDIYDANEIKADSFIYTSDERLKEDITPLQNSLDKVTSLKGISFDWKKNGESSIGLTAQNVEEVFPEAVSSGEDGLKGVNYGVLTAPLIESVKAQQEQIEEKKQRIEKLEEKTEDQQKQIDQLKEAVENLNED